MMVLMKAPLATSVATRAPRPGRPKTNPLSRVEQVRAAKRAQRRRERLAGIQSVSLKLAARDAERWRVATQQPEFEARLRWLVDDLVIDAARYDNLALLCWNRRGRLMGAEEAFHLYERNWRLVDQRRLQPAERDLIERLTARYGNGVLNV
jgi:hypothetical protein